MALSEKEAAVIRSAIENMRTELSAMAATCRVYAQDIANIGSRVQTLQENMQIVMAECRPAPIDEITALIVEARQKINDIDKLAKTIKAKPEK